MSELSALARSIGHKIRQCRLEKNLTQENLAKGLFSKSYISQLERGVVNPSLRALRLLADRLGVSHTWLLESGNSPPSLLIQAATATFYLGNTNHAKELLSIAKHHQNSFTRRDEIEAGLLEARFFSHDQLWEKVLETCNKIDQLIEEADDLPRRHLVSFRYLIGTAWFHKGNRRQAIRHWEIGLAELNRTGGPPSHEGLSLLQSLGELYAALGDDYASQKLQARLLATATQIESPGDLSHWVLAKRQDRSINLEDEMPMLADEAEDLTDAEAWARASLLLTTAANIRKSLEKELLPADSKPG